MKRVLLSMMVFMVLAAPASAQVKVTGRVIDLQNKPVSDVTLEDGLKRLPGVDVAQSGAISYMGKPISQFFAEQSDHRSSATSRDWTCWAASTTWRRGTSRQTT